jgi:hypothetical protein
MREVRETGLRFRRLDRGADGGVGDCPKCLGLILLVTVQVDFADAVGAGFHAEGMDRGVCAQGTAGEALAGGRCVRQHLTTADETAQKGETAEYAETGTVRRI